MKERKSTQPYAGRRLGRLSASRLEIRSASMKYVCMQDSALLALLPFPTACCELLTITNEDSARKHDKGCCPSYRKPFSRVLFITKREHDSTETTNTQGRENTTWVRLITDFDERRDILRCLPTKRKRTDRYRGRRVA